MNIAQLAGARGWYVAVCKVPRVRTIVAFEAIVTYMYYILCISVRKCGDAPVPSETAPTSRLYNVTYVARR